MSSSSKQDRRKKVKYRSDGTGIWQRPIIDGPGIWATCPKGKEKQAIGELYDLFESIAEDLWSDAAENNSQKTPGENQESESAEEEDEDLSLEAQLEREVKAMKRPRKQQLFSSCQTNTPCVIFISCKKPVDPVRLVLTHLYAVKASGITKTRHALRLTPISVSCSAAMESIQQMCKKLFTQYFERQPDQTYTFKIELKMRNHTTLSRPDLLKTIAECVPPPHKVNLDSPQVFILVEVFKALCGVSVVQDYDTLRKFNVQELATASRTEGVSVEDIVSRV